MSAAAPDTWMPLWIGPYLANTLHLNRAQHGSYQLMIMACWKAGGRLPNNDSTLATIARCSAREWKAEREIFAAFFQMTAQWWTHDRVMAELEKARGFKEKQTQNGAKGGRPPNPKETQTKPTDNPNGTTLPSPSHCSVPNGTGAKAPARDVIFAEALPWLERRSGKNCRSIVGKWLSEIRDDAAILELLQACEQENPVDPVGWITARLKPEKPHETWDQRRIREAREAVQ